MKRVFAAVGTLISSQQVVENPNKVPWSPPSQTAFRSLLPLTFLLPLSLHLLLMTDHYVVTASNILLYTNRGDRLTVCQAGEDKATI